MAYLSFLASVPESEVLAIRADAEVRLQPSLIVYVSHLIAYFVEVQPLGELLGKAIDGGEILNDKLTFRFLRFLSPTYHNPQSVRLLHADLTASWQQATQDKSSDLGSDMWYRMEIGKTLQAFEHAAKRGECLVSAIEPRSYILFAKRPA
jgi:hypothetical protein